MTDRRHPHRPFEPDLIRGFLRGRRLIAAELLPQGKCNSNYKLTMDDGQTVVLRMRSRGNADHEAYVMGRVRGLVPTPVELDRGDGWSVFTFLEGEHLANHMDLVGEAAAALAQIGSIEFSSSGWINADGTVSRFSFGSGEPDCDDFMAAMLASPAVLRWIGNEGAEQIARIMKRESGRMDELGRHSQMVHGDFNPTNILVLNGNVSGVLDWEFSHSGTPYMDVGNLLRHTDPGRSDQIRAGLEAGGMCVRDDWLELAELVDISSQLEFLTSNRSDAFKRQCRARIERFIHRYGSGS